MVRINLLLQRDRGRIASHCLFMSTAILGTIRPDVNNGIHRTRWIEPDRRKVNSILSTLKSRKKCKFIWMIVSFIIAWQVTETNPPQRSRDMTVVSYSGCSFFTKLHEERRIIICAKTSKIGQYCCFNVGALPTVVCFRFDFPHGFTGDRMEKMSFMWMLPFIKLPYRGNSRQNPCRNFQPPSYQMRNNLLAPFRI